MPNPGVPVSPGEYKKRRQKAVETVSKLEPRVKNTIGKMYKTPSSTSAVSTPRSRNVSGDQSNVQKVYRWVRQNWSKPGPYGK